MMKKKLSFGYKAFVMVLFAFILWNGSMVTVGAKKTTNSSNSKSEQQLTESEKSLEDLPEKIQEVIAGKRRFIDATDGKKYTLKSYRMLNLNDEKVKVHWGSYIVADIDSDGQNELIVEVVDANNVNGPDVQRRVFDQQDNKVYCYTYPYRAILRVYKDGVIEGSSGAADNDFYKVDFNKRKTHEEIVAQSISTESGKVNYYIGSKKVSQKKFQKFIKKYQPKKQLTWSEEDLK